MIKLSELRLDELRQILSDKEIEVVGKRLQNKHITQTESNYLSRSIRPKLKAAQIATSLGLLSLLNYRRKKYERDNKIIRNKLLNSFDKIFKNNKNPENFLKAIVLYGSYVQNNHTNYRDIDVLIILNKKIWKTSVEKYNLEKNIEQNIDLNIDIHLVLDKDLIKIFPYSPLLQTELENYELIYGNFNLKSKKIINKKYAYIKLLEIESILELGRDIDSRYIYNALRTCISIRLFINHIVSNKLIIKEIIDNLGFVTMKSLIEDRANKMQRDISLKYLSYLYKRLEKELK